MNEGRFITSVKIAIVASVLAGMLFLFLFFYLGINQRRFAYDDSRKWAQEVSRKAAAETELYLTPALTAARSMAEKAVFLRTYGGKREEIKKILLTSLNQNPNFLCAWNQMEPNAYDNLDNFYKGDSTYDVNGSMSLGYFRYKGVTIFERNNADDFLNDYYTIPKARQKEMIVEPYYYVYHGHTYNFYETSAVVPIMNGNEFLGVFAVDIDLHQLQHNLNKIRPYNEGFLALITTNGTIVSHIDSTFIHKNFYDLIRRSSVPKYQALKDGKELTIETISEFSKKSVFRFFYPIFVGAGSDPWYVMIEIPVDVASARSEQLVYVASGTLILGLLLLLYLVLNILDRKRSDKIITDAFNEIEEQSAIAIANARNYLEIFNSTNEAIFIHDANTGDILDVNEVVLKMYGFSTKEEVFSCTMADISSNVAPYTANDAKKYIEVALKEGYCVFDWQARRKNGEVFWTEVSLSSSEIGGFGRILAVVRDIAEKKQIETELEKYRFKLELLVKERTEDLEVSYEELSVINEELLTQRERLEESYNDLQKTQDQLVQIEKMASLGVLAAGVAHEINNPLNYINGGALGIKSYFEDNLMEHLPYVLPLIDAIDIGVDRAADIVKSLNRFSRQSDSLTEKCDIHAVINNCLVILINQFKNRIEIVKEFTNDNFLMLGNEGKLHQAILNVLGNSIHAIKDEGEIHIGTAVVDDNIVITIKDSGYGISAENLNKIFDPFFTTKEPGQGTGLGLSITFQIIQEHAGTIVYESKMSVGTTAVITIPIKLN